MTENDNATNIASDMRKEIEVMRKKLGMLQEGQKRLGVSGNEALVLLSHNNAASFPPLSAVYMIRRKQVDVSDLIHKIQYLLEDCLVAVDSVEKGLA